MHNLALALQKKGLVDEAIQKYEKAIDLDPNFAASYLNLGLLYWKNKNNVNKAIEYLQKYRFIDPNSTTSQKVEQYIGYLSSKK